MKQSLVLGTTLLVLTACGAGGPEATADAFWRAGQEGDVESARALVSETSNATISDETSSRIEDYSVGAATVEGHEASVETRLVVAMGEGTREVDFSTSLVREDGQWKVDLDRTTSDMMRVVLGVTMEELGEQLGEAMGEAMEGAMEGMAEGMRQMGEALGEAMEEAAESMESTGNR